MKAFVLETWASGDEAIYRYIISWFAGLVTNLKSINMVALAMVAKQGTGKGFFLQFTKYIIRGINICETQGIGSITQKHNTAIQNKRLVVINEMSSTRDEFKSNFDKIKTYITDPVVQIEPKGVDPYQITNISNFLLFTNHRDSIIIEESDR
jgi:phage/plasmid-associated DNA primase